MVIAYKLRLSKIYYSFHDYLESFHIHSIFHKIFHYITFTIGLIYTFESLNLQQLTQNVYTSMPIES